MKVAELKYKRRERRTKSVRRRISRTGVTTRLTVIRSLKHIQAQIFNEATGQTVCGVSTSAKRFAAELAGKTKTERATFIGTEIARMAKEKGIEKVSFDRGACKYHGRVKALAEAAREGGLAF